MVVATTALNVRIGPNLLDVMDYAANPIRSAGGNPVVMFRHTGGGTSGSKSDAWGGGHPEMDALFNYLLDPSREVHFDVVSIESEQYVNQDTSIWPRSRRLMYPDCVTSFQRNTRNAKLILNDLIGSNPNLWFGCTGSHGSWLNTMSMCMQPEFGGSGQPFERRRRFDTRGMSSQFKASIVWAMAYPDWRKLATADGITFTGVGVAGATITGGAGAFAHFRYSGSSDQFVVVSGSGTVVPGSYPIAAKNADNAHLTLVSGIGTGTATGYLSTDQTDLRWSGMLLGTKSPGNGADGVPIYSEWDAMPKSLIAALSPQAWVEANQVRYFRPTNFISGLAGNGIHPYGNLYDGATDIHDYHGAQKLSQALSAKGKSSTFQTYNGFTNWTNGTIPAQLYAWLVARMNE